MLPYFFFRSLFPVQQTTSGIGHRVKVVFRVGNQYAECEKQQQKFLPDIILLTQCYLHRGTCLNAMKRFCICSL